MRRGFLGLLSDNTGAGRRLLRILGRIGIVPVIAPGGTVIVVVGWASHPVLHGRRGNIVIGCRRITIDEGTEIVRRPALILLGRRAMAVNLGIDGWLGRDIQHGTGSRKGTCSILSKDRANLFRILHTIKTIT
jgi:hypothetical protein